MVRLASNGDHGCSNDASTTIHELENILSSHDFEMATRRRSHVAMNGAYHNVPTNAEGTTAVLDALERPPQEQQQHHQPFSVYSSSSHRQMRWNFVLHSILFSANHSAGLACLALASTRFGSQGAWQTGILYGTYTGSALLGLTVYVVQRYGSQRATVVGMALFSLYVGASCVGGNGNMSVRDAFIVYTGAAFGGMGAGVAWTAQGVYLSESAAALATTSTLSFTEMTPVTTETNDNGHEHFAVRTNHSLESPPVSTVSSDTSRLAAMFACAILVGETVLDVIATVLVRTLQVHWSVVFTFYLLIAVASTIGMHFVPGPSTRTNVSASATHSVLDTTTAAVPSHDTTAVGVYSSAPRNEPWHQQLTATLRLLGTDAKMKYMIGFTAAFGCSGAFLNAFVSGEVVPRALNDPSGSYVGVLVALHGLVAALGSILCGQGWWWPSSMVCIGRNEVILMFGSISFGLVALPFLWRPNIDEWTWGLLVMVYTFQGLGRATFEGTLKVLFAEYFTNHLEAAFSNIILQYGLSSATAYALSTRFHCTNYRTDNRFCIEYRDGSHHDLFRLAAVVVGASVVSVVGILRASQLVAVQRQCPVQQTIPD